MNELQKANIEHLQFVVRKTRRSVEDYRMYAKLMTFKGKLYKWQQDFLNKYDATISIKEREEDHAWALHELWKAEQATQ